MLDKKQEGFLAFHYDIQKNKNLVQDFRDRNLQVNLWKYMLVGALVCLLLETAFVRLL